MSNVKSDKPHRVSKTWVALKRLDKNALAQVSPVKLVSNRSEREVTDDRVVALREVSIPPAADAPMIRQIISTTFGLLSSDRILKMKNHRGCLIPLNSLFLASSKHMPYVLEVTRIFQHVRPKPRTIATTVINKSMKTRLQTIDRRIQRLEELLPEVKLRRNEKLRQEIECLNQKLSFLHKKMQVADSRSWKGVLIRAPLW